MLLPIYAAAALMAAFALAAFCSQERGDAVLRPAVVLGIPGICTVLTIGAGTVLRRRLDTTVSRRAMALVPLLPAAVLWHRIVLMAMGASLPITLAGDLAIGATLGLATCITLIPRAAPIALLPLLGSAGIAARPDLMVLIYLTVAVSAMMVSVFVLWPRRARGSP